MSFMRYFYHKLLQNNATDLQLSSSVVIDRYSYKNNLIQFGAHNQFMEGTVISGAVSFGDYSYTNRYVEIAGSAETKIDIGSYVSIGRNTLIIATNDHDLSSLSTYPADRLFANIDRELGAAITIGNDVWIGAYSIIMPGVTIETGAVIGAGSVVPTNTHIKSYEIWAGNPAKKIKDRFSDDIKEKLLKSAWWKLEKEALEKKYKKFFVGAQTVHEFKK